MTAAIALRNDSSEFERLQAFATEFAARRRLAAGELARLLVILDELFSNAVSYGYDPAAPPGTIEVALSLDETRLTLEFSDDGQPFDPLAAAEPDLEQAAAQRPVGGLGIHLVRNLVDQAGYRRAGGRNRLTLIRILPKA